MRDFFALPPGGGVDLQYWLGGPGGSSLPTGTWQKPRNARLVYILTIGAGGGGGAGMVGAAGTVRCGGGGGASGSITKVLIPAIFLPDELWIYAGAPGQSVTSGTAGTGGNSTVALVPSGTGDRVNVCYATGGTGGVSGTTAVGTGGTAPTTPTAANCSIGQFGLWTTNQGVAGANSGATTGAAGVAITPATIQVTGGAGGASIPTGNTDTFAGGAISASGVLPAIPGGLAGSSGGPYCGSSGWGFPTGGNLDFSNLGILSTGGSGGGTNNANTNRDSRGGNGGIGSGGGGGGGVTTGLGHTNRGGNGGPGLVLIAAW